MSRGRFLLVLAITPFILAGCTAQPSVQPEDQGPSPTPDFSDVTRLPPGYVDEDSGEVYEPEQVPEWDSTSRLAAVAAGEQAMTMFARPTLDKDTWWDEISPLMTETARQNYAYVEPTSIPASKVTGPGELVDDESAYLAYVEVPTNAGTFTVILNREDADSDWKIARYVFPEQD